MNQSSDLEDLEAGNIQYTNEILSLLLGLESLVDAGYEPHEHLAVNGLGQGSDRVHDLLNIKNSLHTPFLPAPQNCYQIKV